MITTLDAQPQEWMEGEENIFHTVAACHFENLAHIEHWIQKLVPRNRDGKFVKWSGGRRPERTRSEFFDNCLRYSNEFDFKINCISSKEGEMSWFAWAFYMQNQRHISQRPDAKGRNCLVFKIDAEREQSFPVLRAGYLIWYHHVIRYLAEMQGITGKLLSDNFANDQPGPGAGCAKAVSFVNFLLNRYESKLQISLPVTERYKACDRLSDYFCGWVNSVRSNTASKIAVQKLAELEGHPKNFIENVTYLMNLNITDEQGNDVTEAVKLLVANNSAGANQNKSGATDTKY